MKFDAHDYVARLHRVTETNKRQRDLDARFLALQVWALLGFAACAALAMGLANVVRA